MSKTANRSTLVDQLKAEGRHAPAWLAPGATDGEHAVPDLQRIPDADRGEESPAVAQMSGAALAPAHRQTQELAEPRGEAQAEAQHRRSDALSEPRALCEHRVEIERVQLPAEVAVVHDVRLGHGADRRRAPQPVLDEVLGVPDGRLRPRRLAVRRPHLDCV